MRSRKRIGLAALAALLVGLVVPALGASPGSAQEHEHPTTSTTASPGPTTTEHPHPTTSTTAPSGPAPTIPPPPDNPNQRTTVIKYGPYQQQAAVPKPDGSHGHWHSGNQFAFGVQKPCTNCYITGMVADLVYPDGTQAGYSTGSQLHHMVLFNQDAGREDATCHAGIPFPLGLLFGQRFFASGDERTPVFAPPGYGYYVGSGANWNLIWDLAGMSRVPKTVYYQVTYHWVPAPADITNLEPVWFDVAQCGFSTFTAMPGRSSHSWSWTVNRPGNVIGIGGHGHDGTINIVVKNDSTGQVICDSRAGYGESPLYIDPEHGDAHISSMSTCISPNGPAVQNGQRVTMTANYDMAKQDDGQMGIVLAYIGAPRSGGGGGCATGTNQAHVDAGRATAFLIWVWAKGSNAYIGTTWESSSLKEGPAGTWTKVASC
ncbi:MAG TPA: hypothetical protein VIL36_16585 [Acidimicrobiales bacterium]